MTTTASIDSVNIGHGGKTPDSVKANVASTEGMKEGFMYGDASSQSSVYVSDELKKKREELAKRTGIADQTSIFSTDIADKLLALSDDQLGKLTEDKYKVLTMPSNINWTVTHIDEIGTLDPMLFLPAAVSMYVFFKASIQDLKDLDESKIKLLISSGARAAYSIGKLSAAELKDLPELQIWQKIGYANLSSEFPNQDFTSIESVTEISKIQVLLSYEARNAYRTGKVSIADLKDLDEAKIKLLLSIAVYREVSIADSKDLDESKIKLLLSYEAREAYRTGKVSVADLKDLPELQIWQKIGYANLSSGFPNQDFSSIKSVTEISKIQELLSSRARAAYRTRKVSIADLKDLDESKIQLLISYEVIEAYSIGKVSIADLKDFSEESIKLLTSESSVQKLKEGSSFADALTENKSKLSHEDKILAERIIQSSKEKQGGRG